MNTDKLDNDDSHFEDSNATQQWESVFEETRSGLRSFLSSRLGQAADVDDCLQSVMLKAITKGNLVPQAARRAWLFRVAANEAALLWRRKKATQKVVQEQINGISADTISTVSVDAAESLIRQESLLNLRKHFDRLPDASQQILRLKLEEDLTFQQIADSLNIPLGTALTRMRRALQRLRQEMEPEMNNEDRSQN